MVNSFMIAFMALSLSALMIGCGRPVDTHQNEIMIKPRQNDGCLSSFIQPVEFSEWVHSSRRENSLNPALEANLQLLESEVEAVYVAHKVTEKLIVKIGIDKTLKIFNSGLVMKAFFHAYHHKLDNKDICLTGGK